MIKGIKIAGRAIEVLHVEDSVGDANLLKQVLKKAGFPNKLNSVTDGEQALQFLKKERFLAFCLHVQCIIKNFSYKLMTHLFPDHFVAAPIYSLFGF